MLFYKKRRGNKREVAFCGIKLKYKVKKKYANDPKEPAWDNGLKDVFAEAGISLSRENGQYCVDKGNLHIEGSSFNTLITANDVLYKDEYFLQSSDNYVMFDIGLNIGMTSLYKAEDKHIKKIYAFEPFKPTFELAVKNLKNNPQLSEKISIFNFGLGNGDKFLEINYNSERPGAMSSVRNVFENCSDVEKIEIKKASDVLKPLFDQHKEKIFMKIDCEGAEKEIIPDLNSSGLLKRADVVIMEWHFEDPSYLVSILRENGFVVFCNHVKFNELGMIRAVRTL